MEQYIPLPSDQMTRDACHLLMKGVTHEAMVYDLLRQQHPEAFPGDLSEAIGEARLIVSETEYALGRAA
jgi:hypothetical protein